MKPLISIIVPVYNIELYIEKCIDSILGQSYQHLEIIIIDDGSTDNSGKICDQRAKVDERIKVYHTKNRGLVAARKLGLEKATGQYIGFVDGDDYVEKNMYENMLMQLIEDGSDYIHSMYINEINNSIEGHISEQIINVKTEIQKVDFFNKHIWGEEVKEFIVPSIWSKLFKSEFIKKCYSLVPNEQSYGEDWICLFVSVMEAEQISFTNNAYYHYIIREGSLSHDNSKKCFFSEIHLYHHLLECISLYKNTDLENLLYGFSRRKFIQLIENTASIKAFIPRFFWEDMSFLKGKKIILYGAGNVGRDYYTQIRKYEECEIVYWVDINADKIEYDYTKVYCLQKIKSCAFDYVLIAIDDENLAKKVCCNLEAEGIPKNKLLWEKPRRY